MVSNFFNLYCLMMKEQAIRERSNCGQNESPVDNRFRLTGDGRERRLFVLLAGLLIYHFAIDLWVAKARFPISTVKEDSARRKRQRAGEVESSGQTEIRELTRGQTLERKM